MVKPESRPTARNTSSEVDALGLESLDCASLESLGDARGSGARASEYVGQKSSVHFGGAEPALRLEGAARGGGVEACAFVRVRGRPRVDEAKGAPK